MSYKDSDYTIVIALICWLEGMHFCAETHLDDGDFSVFVFPSTTIARVPHLNIFWKYSSQEGSQRFSLHCHDCHHALTRAKLTQVAKVWTLQ